MTFLVLGHVLVDGLALIVCRGGGTIGSEELIMEGFACVGEWA